MPTALAKKVSKHRTKGSGTGAIARARHSERGQQTLPPRVMDLMGVTTTAVPQAATSVKVWTSSQGTGRCSTVMPMSFACCSNTAFVHDGKIESAVVRSRKGRRR